MKRIVLLSLVCGLLLLCLGGCRSQNTSFQESPPPQATPGPASPAPTPEAPAETPTPSPAIQTGIIPEHVLESDGGTIHYSYFLPQGYDPSRLYPLVVTMPGYDRMWFGEDSSGANLSWNGFLCWTELEEDVIVVSAQLTDWGETSARQAIALTEYFLETYAVDPSRVYAAGYSAGGETMSRAVSMRPDLYAAYLHGASQWDGNYAPLAENAVAVYIFMAASDEYYGSQRARDAYANLHEAYVAAGWTDATIDRVLQVQIPDDSYFNQLGYFGNYHGAGNVVFDDPYILQWILSQEKQLVS